MARNRAADRLRQLPRRLVRQLVRAAAAVPAAAAAVRRHSTPRRALAALLAVSLPAAGALAAASGRPLDQPSARWAAVPGPTAPATPTPTVPAAPEHPGEPPRPIGTGPELSPPAPVLPAPLPPPGQSGEFVSWAVLDLASGTITGSGNLAATSTTASMIKAWIVADYLRLTAEAGNEPTPERLGQLTAIIRDSHNTYANVVFQEIGSHASVERMIGRCGLTDSAPYPDRWSNTRMSPRDTARMGACLADGRGAGPEWTGWLLDEMRAVRGLGDFGIRHAFPPEQRGSIAIKNGWVPRFAEDTWHVNCLAIGDTWTMGVLTRYPERLGYQHGAEICRSLAAQHLQM